MSTFFQSQGAARGGAYFGDPTDEFRFIQVTISHSIICTAALTNAKLIQLQPN